MTTDPQPVPDDRASRLDAAMRRHQYRQDALIEILHAAQGLYGYLGPELLYSIARRLKLPPSRVYGVATFYHFFTLEPMGRHACVVCTGTACYVHGADDLVAAVAREAGVGPGGTTADGAVSLLTARCLGACGAAPVAVLDGEILGFQTADGLVREVKGWLAGGTVGPE